MVLVGFKALAELRTERKRTYLGFLWWFFEPAFLMAVFYFVFGMLIDRGGPGYVAVLLTGLVLWQWFHNAIMHCSGSVQGAMSLLRSVRVDVSLFPLATFVAGAFKFLMVLVVLVALLAVMGYPPGFAWVALPLVLLAEAVWVCGVSLIVAALVPFVPDLRFIIAPLLQGLFFVSGVFFSLDDLPEKAQAILEYDPMAVIIDCARIVLLEGRAPDLWRILRVFAAGVVVLAFGLMLLRCLASRYPKLAK